MINFGTSDRQVLYQSRINIRTSTGQALVSKTKHKERVINNTNNNKLDQPKNENEIIVFFEKENWPILEAKSFIIKNVVLVGKQEVRLKLLIGNQLRGIG